MREQRDWSTAAHRLGEIWRRLVTQLLLKPLFGALGRHTTLYPPTLLRGARRMRIGHHVLIRRGCRLEIIDHGQDWTPDLVIGNHVTIEQNVHIVCHDRVHIGDHVAITGHCAIVDTAHVPAMRLAGRPDIAAGRSFVEIGAGSFLGFGSTVLPNVRIGRGCFVGAGAVVTHDLPDYAVAAGVPARVLRIATPPPAAENDHEA